MNRLTTESTSQLRFFVQPYVRDTLVLLSFLFLSLWVYRGGIVALPRGDHLAFIRERVLRASDSIFFWDSLSYNRARFLYVGDYYLFHPGTHVLLAVIDIFLRHHLYVIGILSILWHSLTSFSLYLVLSKWLGRFAALIVTSLFLIQYSGMEMILWRHISPYMFSLFFFGLGLFGISLSERFRRAKTLFVLIGFFFFLSSLFHATIAFMLIPCSLLFMLSKSPRPPLSKPVLVSLCLIPAFLYLAIDLADLLFYQPPGFWGPADVKPTLLTLPEIFRYSAFFAGLLFTAFALPQLVAITPIYVWERYQWDFTSIP